VLINVKTDDSSGALAAREVRRATAAAQADLDGGGRILLRPSGTEPVIRVMVEGRNGAQVQRWAERIAAAVRKTA
jgi:phosphoglucosamine mutase